MCEIVVTEKGTPEAREIDIRCKKTGKYITVTNKYGMFCEDMCDLAEAKKADAEIDKMLNKLDRLF
jgi:hypothetical protein